MTGAAMSADLPELADVGVSLHRDLLELQGPYLVTHTCQKLAALRYDTHPFMGDAAYERFLAAHEESRRICEVCGEPAPSATWPRLTTRCERHPATKDVRVIGAIARPPGWETS